MIAKGLQAHTSVHLCKVADMHWLELFPDWLIALAGLVLGVGLAALIRWLAW